MNDIRNIRLWGKDAGYLPIHIDAKQNDERYIMLDGGYYDFCIDANHDLPLAETMASNAWSANTKNYIFFDRDDVVVYNWLNNHSDKIPAKIVSQKFSQFISILNRSSYRTSDDIAPFILSLFRQLRNQTQERKEPIEALNLLYRLLISINEDVFTKETFDKWQIQDVPLPNGFDGLVESIKRGVRDITPNLDVLLRHGSGPLFQDAHREVLYFGYQYNLFGEMSDNIALKDNNNSSIHYTPQYLARSIVENIVSKISLDRNELSVFDPACGSGTFLIEILKQLKEKHYGGKVIVTGWDTSESAVSSAKFLLCYEQRTQWTSEQLSIDIKRIDDSLTLEWGSHDIILMNPPFLSMELLKGKDSKDAVISALSDCKSSKRPNQAAAFLNKAIDATADDGCLGTVLPSSLLYYEQYIPLREKIRDIAELYIVARLGNFIFEDALTDVSFIVAHKKNDNKQQLPQTVWCKNQKDAAFNALKELRRMSGNNEYESIQTSFNIYTPSVFPMVRCTWKVIPFSDDVFIQKLVDWKNIGKLKPLSSVFDVRQGALKGCKKAFEITDNQYINLENGIKRLYKPLASAETIGNGHVLKTKYIWFPYDKNGGIIHNEMDLPGHSTVQSSVVAFKCTLQARKGFSDSWWELTRPRNWQYVPVSCIVSKRFGNSKSFAYNDGSFIVEEGNALLLKGAKINPDDYYFYLTIFCSSTFERLLSIYAKPIISGYDLGKVNICDIPIPVITADDFRSMDCYIELCSLGKSMAQGDSYPQTMIDEYVEAFYPSK